VFRLRRVLEPTRGARQCSAVLVKDSGGYRLRVDAGQIDSSRFEQLAVQAGELLAGTDAAGALRCCDMALALWRGSPYAPFTDEEWVSAAAAQLEERRAQVREHRIEALLALGHADRALADLGPLIEQAPFRERLWGQQMLAFAQSGR